MIVSHAHRFIFLKTRKTAGTSIEIALSEFLGPDDVVTRLRAPDEAMRRERGFRGAQHDLRPVWRYRPTDLARAWKLRGPDRAYNHMPAAEVRRWVPDDVWRSYTKVTVVRNPFDSVVSHYFWKTRDLSDDQRPPIADFLRSERIAPLTRNWSTYAIDDTIVADHVYRYEQLTAGLAEFAGLVGLPGTLELPQAKAGIRKDHRAPRELLSDADVALIRQRFARELDTFGYDL